MKKILSLALAGVMMFSALPMAYAADVDVNVGTDVTVTGTQASEYEITVPATLQAGGAAGNVIATGTWKSDETLIVTTADEVEVENTETGMKTMVPVVFDGINAAGNDLAAMSISKAISLEKGDILFGEWVGRIEYNVEFKAGKSASMQYGNLRIENYDAETGVITLRNEDFGFAHWTNIAVTNNDTPVSHNLSDDSMTLSFVANEIGTYKVTLNAQSASLVDYVIIA